MFNGYLRQSIPSHLRNQFNIFQFSNHPNHYLNDIQNHPPNNNNNDNNIIIDNNVNDVINCNYLESVKVNLQKVIETKMEYRDRIWHLVSNNEDIKVVQLIFSLKGIQPDIIINEADIVNGNG